MARLAHQTWLTRPERPQIKLPQAEAGAGFWSRGEKRVSLSVMEISLEGHFGYRRLLRSAVPGVLMMVVTSIYSIVDGLFVSNLVGTTAFAALNLIWPAIALVGALGLMVGTGGSALVSKVKGEGGQERADRIFSMLIFFTLGMSVVLAVPLFLYMEQIAILLGAEGELVRQCVVYGRICAAGFPAFMMQMTFQPYFMAAEKPRLGTHLSVICGLTNIVLDALFIVVFHWGLAGAAAASMLACCIGGFFPIAYFASRRNNSSLHIVAARIEKEPVIKASTNGLSEFVGSIAFNILTICYNLQLMRFLGENGVAAYSVILYVGYIFFAVNSGFNLTVLPLVGYNYGADNKAELHSLLTHSARILLVFGALIVVLAELLARPASALFVGYDEGLRALTEHAMRLNLPCYLLAGANFFTSTWFTGLNNGVVSAVSSFSRSLIFEIGSVFLLPLVFGIDGIWLAADSTEILSSALSVGLYLGLRRRYGY